MTEQQQGLIIREAMIHEDVRVLSKSAGIINQQKYSTYEYVLQNISHVMKLATTTNNCKGRTRDDLRSLEQSIVLSTLWSSQQEQELKGKHSHTHAHVARALGMSEHKYRRIAISLKSKEKCVRRMLHRSYIFPGSQKPRMDKSQ